MGADQIAAIQPAIRELEAAARNAEERFVARFDIPGLRPMNLVKKHGISFRSAFSALWRRKRSAGFCNRRAVRLEEFSEEDG